MTSHDWRENAVYLEQKRHTTDVAGSQLTFVDDILPQRLDERRVVVTGAVHDRQLTLGKVQRVGKVTV